MSSTRQNHRLFTSYTIYSRHLIFLLCVIFVLTTGRLVSPVQTQVQNKSQATSNSRIKKYAPLTIFPKAFSTILDNYIDEPETTPLISGAIKGMEKMLASKSITFTRTDLSLINIEGNKDKSLKFFTSTWRVR